VIPKSLYQINNPRGGCQKKSLHFYNKIQMAGHNKVLKVKGVVCQMLIIQIAQGDERSCLKKKMGTRKRTRTLRSQTSQRPLDNTFWKPQRHWWNDWQTESHWIQIQMNPRAGAQKNLLRYYQEGWISAHPHAIVADNLGRDEAAAMRQPTIAAISADRGARTAAVWQWIWISADSVSGWYWGWV